MKTVKLLFILLLFVGNVFSQTLIEIGDHKVSKKEFLDYYKKNGSKDIDISLEKFINYKLKIVSANDSLGDYKNELVRKLINKFSEQLITPEFLSSYVDSALYRNREEIHIQQIFLALKNINSYSDTLLLYSKAIGIKIRINEGEKFKIVAKQTSDQEDVHISGGDLGYVTSLQLPLLVENVAFNIKIDSVSNPILTDKGYYIIKVINKRKNGGLFKVAHIMVSNKSGIDFVSKQLKNKIKSFSELVKKYSIDKESVENNGELDWFGVGEMPIKFERIAMQLKNIGDVTKPFKCNNNWHIIKLLDVDNVSEPSKKVIVKTLIEGNKSVLINTIIEEAKLVNYYNVNNNILDDIKYVFKTRSIDSIFHSKYLCNSLLLRIQNKKWIAKDFINFLLASTDKIKLLKSNNYIRLKIDEFINNSFLYLLISQKLETDSILKEKYRDYREKLLFSHMYELKVDSKVKNRIMLADYFRHNINKYPNYSKEYTNLSVEQKYTITTDFAIDLDKGWIQDLKNKYPVVVNRDIL